MNEGNFSTMKKMHLPSQAGGERSLFRPEALNDRLTQGYGPLRLAQPLSNWIITLCTVIIIVLFMALVLRGELPRKVSVIGIMQPIGGSLSIIAPNTGILARALVKEGDFVQTGQPLFELSTERQGEVGEVTRLVEQQLLARKFSLENEERHRMRQADEKRTAVADHIKNLTLQEAQLDVEIELASKRIVLSEQTVEKFRDLHNLKFASTMQLQEKQELLLDLEGRLGSLKRARSQLRSNRLELEAQYKDLASTLTADLIRLHQSKATLEQEMIENQNRRGALIIAPRQGQITGIPYKIGQSILNGQVLATLIAGSQTAEQASELEVHLYMPSRTVGFIAEGQLVRLRFQAFPYQKFGLQRGVITSIGTTPFAPNEIPTNIAATILNNAQQSALGLTNNEALYRVIVKPEFQYIQAYGKKQFLKSGMSLDADIVQEQRYIWEWLLEPARALRGI